jgi:2-C-methyl-D-erythritol 4-phosphate cytidylyltransferase
MAVRAIILMGGTGERFGSGRPKQLHLLAGKKIYLHTLDRFVKSGLFEEILLVVPPQWREEIEKDCPGFRIIDGGMTRQESSYRGIMACPEDTEIVVIHDAVRPFVTERILKENIDKAREMGAVDTCIPSADTLVYAPSGDLIEAIPIRSHFLRGQTPQSFRLSLIKKAHLYALERKIDGVSDDCRLVKELDLPVAIVSGDERNIKITTPLDLHSAEQFLRQGFVEEPNHERKSLSGCVFAITGGTGGIGKEVARILENEGAKALLLSPSSKESPLDFRNPKSIKACFESIGCLDGLINCAGVLDRAPLRELSEDSIDAQIDVNFRGVVHACKYANLKEGGHIINVASSSYYRGREEISVYAAAKAAIVNFSQGLAQERPDLIINVAAPCRTDTPMRKEHYPEENPDGLLSATEVAEAIVDLLRQNRNYSSVIEIRTR